MAGEKIANKTTQVEKQISDVDAVKDAVGVSAKPAQPALSSDGWKERLFKIKEGNVVTLRYKDELRSAGGIAAKVQDGGKSNDNDIKREEFISEDDFVVTGSYQFSKERIELEPGVSVIVPSESGIVSEKRDGVNRDSKSKNANTVVFFSPNAEIALKPKYIGEVEEQTVKLSMLHFISACYEGATGEINDIEVSAYLKDPVVFQLGNGYAVSLNEGEYTKHAGEEIGTLKFWDTKVEFLGTDIREASKVEIDTNQKDDWLSLYHSVRIEDNDYLMKNPTVDKDDKSKFKAESAETNIDGFSAMLSEFQSGKDDGVSFQSGQVKTKLRYGKNPEDSKKQTDDIEDFVDFNIEKNTYQKGNFQNEVQSNNMVASNKLTEIDENGNRKRALELKKEIFTRDGFVKVEKSKFEFVKKKDKKAQIEGEGKVEFLPIKYVLKLEDGTEVKGDAVGKEAVDDVSLSIDADGNLNAEFKDDAEATLNLNTIKKKSNDAEGLIRKFTLSKLSIKDGYLVVDSIRMDEGVKIEKGDDVNGHKLLKIFDCSMTGTVATESEEAKMTPEGIAATMKKSTFGTYQVEDFMGFLGGKIDYPKGAIEVSAKKELEGENLEDSFFSFSGEHSVSIPTGILGLNAKFGVKPSAAIGGTVGLKAERGEPFDKEWKDKSALEIGGSIETEGKAGIGAEAGVELGIPGIANMDLAIEGKLSLKASGKLEGGTGFQYNKDEGKFEQNKNFKVKGEIGGELEGTLGLTSGVKFLFWKMQLFNFEFLKKKLGSLKFSFEGEKSLERKGLLEGWILKSKQFNAEWFSNELQKKYKVSDGASNQSPIKKYTSEELQKMLDEKVMGVEDAWATLCALKDNKGNTAIFFDEENKKPLDTQIANVTKEVTEKITECIDLLNESNKVLEGEKIAATNEIQKRKLLLRNVEKQNKLSDDVFEKAEWGGFNADDAKYQKVQVDEKHMKKKEVNEIKKQNNEKLKMAAVDLMIARMLGEVSEQNLAKIRDDYVKYRDYDDNRTFNQLSKEEQDDFYKERTEFLISEVRYYDDQTSFYTLLNEKVLYDKYRYVEMDMIKDKEVGKDIHIPVVVEDKNKDKKNVQNDAIKKLTPRTLIYRFQRDLKNFPDKFHSIIEKNPEMKMSEFLKLVLKNDIGVTAKDKLDLLKMAFGIQAKNLNNKREKLFGSGIRDDASLIKGGLARSTSQKFEEVFSNSTSLDDVIKTHNVMDIFEERKKLQSDFEAAVKAKENAEEQLAKIQNSIIEITKKQEDYNQKLISLRENAEIALKDKAFDANAAKKVVSIYSEDYVKKMKDNKEIESNKAMREGLRIAQSNKNKPLKKGMKIK